MMTDFSENYANWHGRGSQRCSRRCRRMPMGVSLLMGTTKTSMILFVLLISLVSRAEALCLPTFAPLPTLFGTTTTRATSAVMVLSAEGTEQQQEERPSTTPEMTYRIRDCQYRELTSVATLVVQCFYDKKKINLVARKLYQLAEANRLQQNFPYPESRGVHRMLVIEASPQGGENNNVENKQEEPTIVGFCDVDTRPCATKTKLPRPYLSDLAIDPNHRRKGLARMLIEASEEFVQGGGSGTFDQLWIRVASDNDAALGLYRDKLGYSFAEWSTGEETTSGEGDPEIFTLRKDFNQ